MSRALGLLLWLRFRGWWRRLGRHVGSVRGAIFVAFALLLISGWILTLFFSPRSPAAASLETIRRFAPLVMLGYCLLTILTSAGDRSLTFSPAEINFLFAGPFGRHRIVGFKILTATVSTLLSAVFMTLIFRVYAASFLAASLGLLAALLFLQFFGIAVALVSETIGESAFNARRKLAFSLLGLFLLIVGYSLGRDWIGLRPLELLERTEALPVVQFLLTPFRWFGNAFTAEQVWPDLVVNLVPCLLVNAVLLAVVFLLDKRYLETASAASERMYRRLERMRAGPAAAMSGGGGTARFTMGNLPWWGGAGPIAWRQALTALRNLKGLVFIVLTFASFLVIPLVVQRDDNAPSDLVPRLLNFTILGMSMFLLQILSYDFRGDLDRMEVLKSLPISTTRLVIGQLLTPVLMACTLQMTSFLVIELIWGGLGEQLTLIPLFLVPFNVLLFEVMNLLFLWFPTRLTPATAGDFQMIGRQMMLFLAIYLLVVLLVGIPAAAGWLVYFFILGNPWAGYAVAWVLLVGTVCGLVPLLALAFRNFDVARDTPP